MSELFPARALLAIQAVLFIAYHGRGGKPIKSYQMVKRYKLSERALEPALQKLTQKGILSSKQGANGGYSILRPERTTLADVAELFIKQTHKKSLVFSDLAEMLTPALQTAHDKILHELSQHAISHWVQILAQSGIPDLEDMPVDFTI